MIKNLEFTPGFICWRNKSERIDIVDSKAIQALADTKKDLIIVLRKTDEDVDLLEVRIIGPEGKIIANLKAPESFTLSYLTHHPELGVAVVAGANERIDGWYDWHFGCDVEKTILFRHCPAY